MICPECGKTGLQVSGMHAGLEGCYEYTNLITRVGITCLNCSAEFETQIVNILGLRRVKRGMTTTNKNSSTRSSAKDAESCGKSSQTPTSQSPDCKHDWRPVEIEDGSHDMCCTKCHISWGEPGTNKRDYFFCGCEERMVPRGYPCEVCQ